MRCQVGGVGGVAAAAAAVGIVVPYHHGMYHCTRTTSFIIVVVVVVDYDVFNIQKRKKIVTRIIEHGCECTTSHSTSYVEYSIIIIIVIVTMITFKSVAQ